MMTKYNLQKMRKEAYQFIIKIESLYYQNWIGLLDKIEIGPVFEEYKHLFTLSALRFIKKQKGNNKDEKKRLRHLLGCFIEYHMELKTKEIRQEIMNTESRSFIKFSGEKIYYRSIMPKVLKEPKRMIRLEMFRLRKGLQLRKLNPLKRQLVETYLTIPKKLGCKNYIVLCEKVQEYNLRKFAEKMEDLLDDSENLFIKYLDHFLSK